MKLKSLILIVAILAAISVLVFAVRRPATSPSADARLGQPLLDRNAAESAAQIRFSDAGKSIVLVKQSDGSWRVPAYYDFPADFTKISRFIGELTDTKLTRLVTTSPERIARLEFKDTQIALLDAAGKELWSATLGKNSESGGRFIRFGAEEKAYLAPLNLWLDPEPKNWARTSLLDLKPEEIAKIEIPFESAPPVVVSREKKGESFTAANSPAGQTLKADRINSVLSSLTALTFTDTNDLSDTNVALAKTHQRVFKLTTFDHKTYTVALARKPEQKKIKPPVADAKSGPASLGKSTDLTSAENGGKAPSPGETSPIKPVDPKFLAPEFETIPAGPVFVVVTSSEEKSSLNALMQKRAFQTGDYVWNSLPQQTTDLFESTPAAATPSPAKPQE